MKDRTLSFITFERSVHIRRVNVSQSISQQLCGLALPALMRCFTKIRSLLSTLDCEVEFKRSGLWYLSQDHDTPRSLLAVVPLNLHQRLTS